MFFSVSDLVKKCLDHYLSLCKNVLSVPHNEIALAKSRGIPKFQTRISPGNLSHKYCDVFVYTIQKVYPATEASLNITWT